MSPPHDSAADSSDREIVIERVVDAPPELVFKVWTEPEHMAQWWGPNGFRTTVYEMDVRPGGMSRYMMHGPDGTDYPNRTVFLEVAKPTKLVYWHGSDIDEDPERFHATATFAAEGKKTRVTLRLLFATSEQRKTNVDFGAIEAGQQTLARLGDYVTTM